MKTFAALCLFVILFLSSTANCFDLTQDYKTKDDFVIHLPKDWVQIPNEVLRQYEQNINQFLPPGKKQSFDYGFQLNSGGTWMTYPYILIQIRRTGRIPEAQLKQYKQIREKASESIKQTEDRLSRVVSNAQLGETLYDSKNQILWMNIALDVRKVGTVNGQVALKLTEFGLVQIMGYAKKETFADYQPLFQEIAQRVTFDDSVRYRPRLTDAFPMVGGINTGEVLAGAIGAIIIGGIIGLIAMVAKKSRRKNA